MNEKFGEQYYKQITEKGSDPTFEVLSSLVQTGQVTWQGRGLSSRGVSFVSYLPVRSHVF